MERQRADIGNVGEDKTNRGEDRESNGVGNVTPEDEQKVGNDYLIEEEAKRERHRPRSGKRKYKFSFCEERGHISYNE